MGSAVSLTLMMPGVKLTGVLVTAVCDVSTSVAQSKARSVGCVTDDARLISSVNVSTQTDRPGIVAVAPVIVAGSRRHRTDLWWVARRYWP